MCMTICTFMPHPSSSLLQDSVPAIRNFLNALKKKKNCGDKKENHDKNTSYDIQSDFQRSLTSVMPQLCDNC